MGTFPPGGYQSANLGDGNGQHNQTGIYRENFGNQQYGTCQESVDGGNQQVSDHAA